MDFSAFLFERLGHIDGYLYAHSRLTRLFAFGRLCELDQLAFTLRNADFISVGQYDRFDEASARIRRIHNLHGDYRHCDDKSQPGQSAHPER